MLVSSAQNEKKIKLIFAPSTGGLTISIINISPWLGGWEDVKVEVQHRSG